MSTQDRIRLFDDWAAYYDRSVQSTNGFPFGGYEQVIGEVTRLAAAQPHMQILDLGTGTGNLAAQFVALGCSVWGVDFSSEMLSIARTKLPQARFVQGDLLGEWHDELHRCFDRIVSAYVLHHFGLAIKVSLLQQLAHQHLSDDGRIIIGDIAFSTVQARERAQGRWASLWDEDEHYWAADEAIATCEGAGLYATYRQVSSCGGVCVVKPGR